MDPEGRNALVSVVTPTLDPGPRLERCLDSVSRQTHPHVEHVVVDGGSSDGTRELLEARAGVRWLSEPDRGQADALVKGFAMARGEVVGWLNADDTLEPEAAQRAVDALAGGRADVAYGDLRIVDSVRGRTTIRRAARAVTRASFRLHNPIPQPGSFLSAAALRRVGGIDPGFRLAMDFDLWLRLADAGARFAHVDAVVAAFEIHPSSKTARASIGEFWREMSLAYRRSGALDEAEMALERARWRDTFDEIVRNLEAGRYGQARATAREGARRLRGGVAARTPGRGRMRLVLAGSRMSPRLSRLAIRTLEPRRT